MNLASVRPGDLLHVNIKGRLFHAELRGYGDGEGRGRILMIMPLADRQITYRTCKARDVVKFWRAPRVRG